MNIFTSIRERKLWLAALVGTTAIFSTLWIAGRLAGFLRDRNLMRLSTNLGLLLVGLIFVWVYSRKRPGWGEIAAAFGITIVYWWSWIRIQTPEERTHLFEYGILAAIIYQALNERVRNGRTVPFPPLTAWGITGFIGLLDEGVQAVIPGRTFDIRDLGFNVFASTLAVAVGWILVRVRRRSLEP